MLKSLISLREVVGLFLCSFFPSLLLATISVFVTSGLEYGSGMLFVASFTFLFVFTFGLFSVLLLNYAEKYSIFWYCLPGAVFSLALGYIFIYPNMARFGVALGYRAYLGQFLLLLMFSVGTSVSYWLIARPDRFRR